jgi:streptogramin lyase
VGGPGSDIFAFGLDFASTFSASTGADAATISDFEPGVDTLAIAPGIFGIGTVNNATVTFASYNGEAGQGSSVIVDVADGEVWVTEDAGGSVFVNLTGNPAITSQDVVLVPDPA